MDDEFQDCVDDGIPSSRAFDNTLNNVSTPNNDMSIKSNKNKLPTASIRPGNTNTTILQTTGNSSDASTQTVSDEHVKSGKSSKSSCIIA